MNPAELRIVATQVLLGVQVGDSSVDERVELGIAQKRRLRVAFGEERQTERGKRALQNGVRPLLAESALQIVLTFGSQGDEFGLREELRLLNPGIEDRVGEVVAQFGIGRGKEPD